ncbi:MAG TPA: L-seryl-tRNA(Sec) selenium transferase [Pyrinomonadaceae bacterium]|nr:L-seryl-tRNA(Sec) selenium transferase [Pyrinomonadaceae bacterium]
MAAKTQAANYLLRSLPSIDSLLRTATARSLQDAVGLEHLRDLVRKVTEELRQEIIAAPARLEDAGQNEELSRAAFLEEAERRLVKAHQAETNSGLRRVINATGVILHTNLGRAPLSDAARRAVAEVAAGYCSLEYDLATGERGRRGERAEDLLAQVTGAEAALVVNNCAAAALLVLTTLARDGETIVSRGELVEIGGDFRVPEVMAQSGTRMIEVGTTNRTKLSDYRKAISEKTRLIMRVHTSNYRIVGFTKTPRLRDLADLAHEAGRLLYEDAGSGALVDLSDCGITGEPVIHESIEEGADVISFSGDKLLGGPQAGLLVGRAAVIEKMRSHPLYRALRADKLRIAALEATLDAYARGVSADEVPAQRLIATSAAEIKARADRFVERLRRRIDSGIQLEVIEGESAVGGGAAPTANLRTVLISVTHGNLTSNQVEAALRHSTPPVIARIVEDRVLVDLRTVAEAEESEVEQAILALAN